MKVVPVKESYLEKIIPHYLAIGKQFGKIPGLEVLRLVEVLGNCWLPKKMDVEGELAEIKATLPKNRWTTAKRADYLDEIHDLYRNDPLFETWFECSDLSNRAFAESGVFGKDRSKISDEDLSRLSKEVLEPMRNRWLNKIFCMAIMDYHLENQNKRWIYFTALAEQIQEGQELFSIDFFKSVISKSLAVYFQNRALGFR